MRGVLILILLLNTSLGFAQKQKALDVKTISGTIKILPQREKVEGDLKIEFATTKSVDSVYLDAVETELTSVSAKGIEVKSRGDKIWFYKNFKAGKTYRVELSYNAHPRKAMYFKGWDNPGSNQVWTQGQGKENSHWLPSLDDASDKILFNLSYDVPEDYRVIANGKLVDKTTTDDRQTWQFKMTHPMSSYLVGMAFGDYVKQEKMAGDTPLQFFVERSDSAHFEPTYRHGKEIFAFFEKEIGVDFPWQNYKQVPVRDFLYAGMENTGATIFSNRFVIDSTSFVDRNFVNVQAHELAHQWFGDYVTAASSKHHWLQEGFATFYSLLAQKEIFGSDYFYFQLLQNADKLKTLSDNGKGKKLLDPEAGSLTFYQKGAWALFALRKKMGKEAFKKGIRKYLNKNAYQSVTTADFLRVMEKQGDLDLSSYREIWLEQTAFPSEEALNLVKDNSFVQKFLTAKAMRNIGLDEKRHRLEEMLSFPVNEYVGQEVVNQLSDAPTRKVIDLYKKAFNTNNILVRQAIAENLQNVPAALQSQFESLLDDESYFTQEKALMALYQNFPDKRNQYLTKMEGVQGFSNKNVRLLWLTLSLVTREFKIEKSQEFYKELAGYTQPRYPYELRQNAFSYLYQINSFTTENYKNLLKAIDHPVWRFAKYARKLFNKLMEDKERRKEIMMLKPDLSEHYQERIKKVLDKI